MFTKESILSQCTLANAHRLVVALGSVLFLSFVITHLRSYLDPNFVSNYRGVANINTVIGLLKGINPFHEDHFEEYGNLYSVVWPYAVYCIAKLSGLSSYDHIKSLMYVINALIVVSGGVTIVRLGLQNKSGILMSAAIGFVFYLMNSTLISMGELSYTAGLAAATFSLIIANRRFDEVGLWQALALITIASLFKVYFALFVIVVAFNYVALLSTKRVIFSFAVWVAITAAIFIFLCLFFPMYFDAIYVIHRMYQSFDSPQIWINVSFFGRYFGFCIILLAPGLISFSRQSGQEQRRQISYGIGAAVVCAYVIGVMSAHLGSGGAYLVHLVLPIVIGYALARHQTDRTQIDRGAGALATLLIAMMLLPATNSNWIIYGVVPMSALKENRATFAALDEEVRKNEGKSMVFRDHMAIVAVKRSFYVDTGNREYIVDYINARIRGTFELRAPLKWLAGRIVNPTKRIHPYYVAERAEFVVCAVQCPRHGTHQFVRDLGTLTTANNGPVAIRLFHKVQPGFSTF